MSFLPDASNEQLEIIQSLSKCNVIVDSVAGSGKTTTNLHIARNHNDSSILLLTYNKKLKFETREKVKRLNLSNMEVHTYHSFCVKYYDRKCYTDQIMLKILSKDVPILGSPFSYNIIILDEAQDMTPTYFQLVCKLCKDNKINDFRICLLGDKNQSIYDFNKADNRFIILGDRLFTNLSKSVKYSWKRCNLSTSFRVTPNIASFVNLFMLNENRINAYDVNKPNPPVRYVICNAFGEKKYSQPFQEINHFLNNGCGYEEIFVLAPSLKSARTPVKLLANILTKCNIPVYIPNTDEESIDEDVIKGKIAFSTFHQVKGLERKAVLIFYFDKSYTDYYNKTAITGICPNELYVACTRSTRHLTVLHHYKHDYLEFIDKALFLNPMIYESFMTYHATNIEVKDNDSKASEKCNICVTELVKYVPSDIINDCLKYFEKKIVKSESAVLKMSSKTSQQNTYEMVSEITGTGIPLYFEMVCTDYVKAYDTLVNCKIEEKKNKKYKNNQNKNIINRSEINDIFDNQSDSSDDDEPKKPIKKQQKKEKSKSIQISDFSLNEIDPSNMTVPETLYVANLLCAYHSGYHHKINQIKNYDWMPKAIMTECSNRMSEYISTNCYFEGNLKVVGEPELHGKILSGNIDCIDDKTVWEIKCVDELQPEHFIQLALYMYMYKLKQNKIGGYYSTSNGMGLIVSIDEDNKGRLRLYNDKIVSKTLKKTHNIKYYIFNVFKNEIYEITGTLEDLKKMVNIMILHKYFNKSKKCDNEFVKSINKLKSKYVR